MRQPWEAPEQPTCRTGILADLELVTATSGQVVTTAEAKLHCRVDISTDDTPIDAMIVAATEYCEKAIPGHRQFLSCTYDAPAYGFWEGPLRLPRPPLSSVTWLKYYDSGGTLTTLSSSAYLVRTPQRAPGTIERAPGQSWPAVQADRRLPVVIRFVAGYGAASDVPKGLKQAVLLLVSHWYNRREPVGQAGGEVAFTVSALLQSESYGSYR